MSQANKSCLRHSSRHSSIPAGALAVTSWHSLYTVDSLLKALPLIYLVETETNRKVAFKFAEILKGA